ncbi:hypothetical protein AVEN_47142-1 [Araneus ventricosus]|uniref:Uncharacterized protein n=1 Tax=Araneus ventricosus TaxID=182803 RepID=A0A4Y2RFL6_ARAVE|nr:hypothetical protein AVEN_47142-1 [Araneus ventricosus]
MQHEGYFGTDLIIVRHGQMTRTTPGLAHPLSKLPHHTDGRTFGHYVLFTVQQSPYTGDLQRNRVSNLEPSGPKAETLSLGHRGPVKKKKRL